MNGTVERGLMAYLLGVEGYGSPMHADCGSVMVILFTKVTLKVVTCKR